MNAERLAVIKARIAVAAAARRRAADDRIREIHARRHARNPAIPGANSEWRSKRVFRGDSG